MSAFCVHAGHQKQDDAFGHARMILGKPAIWEVSLRSSTGDAI
jgi:hypothetical protein